MDKTQEKTIKTEKSLLTKIAKSTGGITLILTGIKILGFIEKQVLAYYFGTGYQGDAYFVGFSLMIVFWDLSRGLMAPSYLPTLIEYRSKVGEAKSWEFTSTVFNMMSIIFATATKKFATTNIGFQNLREIGSEHMRAL